jgi:hypothetical protein
MIVGAVTTRKVMTEQAAFKTHLRWSQQQNVLQTGKQTQTNIRKTSNSTTNKLQTKYIYKKEGLPTAAIR